MTSAACRYNINDSLAGLACLDAIQAPLTSYMLPHLTPAAIAAARASCVSFQRLIDDAPFSLLQPALCSLLPASLLPSADSMPILRGLLQCHARSLANLRCGQSQHLQDVALMHEPLEEVLWSPSNQLVIQKDHMVGSQYLLDADRIWPVIHTKDHTPAQYSYHSKDSKLRWQIWLHDGYLLSAYRSSEHILAINHSTIQPSIPRTMIVARASKLELSPTRDRILAWSAHSAALVMLSMPSLATLFEVPLPSSLESCQVKRCIAREARWSHTGAYFAVVWRVKLGNAGHSCPLTMHTAHDGACLSAIDLSPSLGWESLTCGGMPPYMQWSPSQSELLMSHCFHLAGTCSPASIVQLDGSHAILPIRMPSADISSVDNPFAYFSSRWSPCGQYVHTLHATTVIRGDHDLADTELWHIEGCIWNVKTVQSVFTWQTELPPHLLDDDDPLGPDFVNWSPLGSMCFIPMLQEIIHLSAGGDCADCVFFSLEGAPHGELEDIKRPNCPAQFVFSPCGKVLLGVVPVKTSGRAVPACPLEPQQARDQPVIFGVWHGLINLEAPVCILHHVGEFQTPFDGDADHLALLKRRIAWHPSPSTWMYALADCTDGLGDVMLIDCNGNRVVSLLKPFHRCQLDSAVEAVTTYGSASMRAQSANGQVFSVDWSPDGEMLLIGHGGLATLVRF